MNASAKAFLILKQAMLIPKPLRICSMLIVPLALALPALAAQTSSQVFSAGRTAVLAGDYDNAIGSARLPSAAATSRWRASITRVRSRQISRTMQRNRLWRR